MKLTIESTDEITTIDGVPVRRWRGRTESGRPVDVFVHRVATADPWAQAELDAVLAERSRPRELADIAEEGRAFGLGKIL